MADLAGQAIVDEVTRATQQRRALRSALESEGFRITWARERRSHGYYVYAKWAGKAGNPFGSPLETMVFVVEDVDALHRDLLDAKEAIEASAGRVNPYVAVIVGPTQQTADLCATASESSPIHWLGTSLNEVARNAGRKQGVTARVRTALFDQDLYARPGAVTSKGDFYGRRSDVTMLAAQIAAGGSHYGLFGLRKVGKTSLQQRILSVLKNKQTKPPLVA